MNPVFNLLPFGLPFVPDLSGVEGSPQGEALYISAYRPTIRESETRTIFHLVEGYALAGGLPVPIVIGKQAGDVRNRLRTRNPASTPFKGRIRKFVSKSQDSQFGEICLKIRQKGSEYVGDAYFLVNLPFETSLYPMLLLGERGLLRG